MSNNSSQSPAEVLIMSAVKTVGKREFLKTVERIFQTNQRPTQAKRQKTEVAVEEQCLARVKGDRTGIKVGRFVLFDAKRCPRHEVSTETHLCAIHTNQVAKLGELPFGSHNSPLTDDMKKVFGEL
jgi:hypothetical protein